MSKDLEGFKIVIDIDGVGQAYGELTRILAPRTVEVIAKALPIVTRAYLVPGGIYFEAGKVNVGFEKPRRDVEAGAIAYWPPSRMIYIFYDKRGFQGFLNVIGVVREGLNLIKLAKQGVRISMRLI